MKKCFVKFVISYDTGKKQDHPPGKPDPKRRNTNSATQRVSQPPAGRTQKGGQKKSFPIKSNTLDLTTLKEKDCTEVVHKLNESMASLKFILRSEEEQYNTDDFIFDLTCTLAIVCDAPAGENTNKILAALKGSAFFSSKIPYFLDRVQKGKTTITDPQSQTRLIESLIKVFNKYLMHLPSSYADPPYDPLRETLNQSNINGTDALKKQLDDFKQRRDNIIKAERQKHGRRYTNMMSQKPPNDFRDIPICPTNKEIKSQERPFLRKNIKKGHYQDVEHYLDVQFRLLREDFLEPLREGIYEITHNIPRAQRNQLMKCYQGVRITGKELTQSGIIYNVHFDVSKFPMTKWAHSKRLLFGSFLCLSKDNFETMLFATVANRDPLNLQKGTFHIHFIEEQNILDIEKSQQEYQMVESPAFFEAYRHVLEGLKGMNAENMPFTKYLVECSDKAEPPEYLVREDGQDPVFYDLSRALRVRNSPTSKRQHRTSSTTTTSKKVPVLNTEAWPSVDTLPLNGSQLEALRTALTTEFSVIQGPPGTGKTYVGAKIVRCLLDNRQQWDPENVSPMLMVCYTNHALDQFLEKVLEFLPKRAIIRVGGRSKSKELEDCNLKVFTKRYRRNHDHVEEIDNKLEEIVNNQKDMELKIEYYMKLLTKAHEILLEFQDLEEGMTSRHADQLYKAIFPRNATSNCQNPTNTFKLWLCNNTQMNAANEHSSTLMESHKDRAHDGSVLQDDYADEDDDVLYPAAVERSDEDSNSRLLQDEVVNPVEPSVQEVPKENTTAGDTETVSDQSPSANAKDKDQLDVNISSLNESLMSYSRNLGWKPAVHEDPRSNIKNDQEGNTEDLQQSQQDGSQMLVSKEIEEPIVAKQVGEEGQSLSGDNGPVSESLDTAEEKSNADEMKLHDAGEETITVEDEAAFIQSQRCIEGEEEYRLVRVQQSDRGKRKEENEAEITENSAEWKTVLYHKNPQPFVWRKEEGGTIRDELKGQVVEGEDSQGRITASKKRKKKKKKKKTENKINLTANIANVKTQLQQETMMPSDEALAVENIWSLSANDRLRLYLYWIECFRERHMIEIQRCKQRYEQKHKELCVELKEIKAQDEEEVIRRATVVGMTTTVAARYHTMLQRISPKIVIIEEAAEVLEAHIITSLSHNTKHTVLIGDHKQLRPKATVYELAQKYNLEISLFERMVLNSMDCKRLCIQHRMRPEIAALTKRIYDHEILDHASVCAFDDISGVKHNMFFLDHKEPEVLVRGLQSFSNPHEARFLVELCRYLLLQGYKRDQITILTMYTGQLLELQSRMPKREFEGIKVCVVDNFQGEENDIILLSLVRSSKIGFLKESNRICVALSRARQGFYCIGNFTLLKSECTLWKEICDHLETKNAIGQTLTLVCKRHSNVNQVRTWSDIEKFPLGGCDKFCGVRLDCGHACDKVCHPTDEFHLPGRCPKVCWKSCPNDHQCQKRCHYPYGCFCVRPVVKIIPQCGHEQTVQCCIKPQDFRCQVKCVKTLDCGHPCSQKCSDRCRCNTMIEVELPCRHGVLVLCPEKSYPPPCMKKCTRKLLECGHECPGLCYEACCRYRCEILVEKLLPCDHKLILPCYFDPRFIRCHEMCQKKCNRGHPCQQQCHFGFPCNDCQVRVNMTIPSCNHNIEMPCYFNPAALVCKKPCERVRTCGHPCRNVCGQNCEARPCKQLVPRTLPCQHTVTLACNKNLQTYKCKVKVVVNLSCGHKKAVDCYDEEAGLTNVLCNEKVAKELPCKHKAILQCHTNIEDHKCMKKVDVTMACGHTKSVTCTTERAGRVPPCMVMTTRKLACEHEVTIPCCEIQQEYNCQEMVDITLPCGHKRRVQCSMKTEDIFCDAPCEKVLSCQHPCRGRCSDDCSQVKCAERVEKTLSCGYHKISCLCRDDVSQIICPNKCTRKLSCGHVCTGKCSQNCSDYQCEEMVMKKLNCPGKHDLRMPCVKDPKTVVCEKSCTKKLDCGHPCNGVCDQPCETVECRRKTVIKFPCGHKKKLSCFQRKTAICSVPCQRQKTSCKHLCKGWCGEPCSKYPCNEPVTRMLRCGHKIEMRCCQNPENVSCPVACGAKLQCGHQCSGTCGDCQPRNSHEICQNPCSRFLVCLHRCRATCCEPCPPCVSACSRRCPHDRCKEQCSKPCNPCRWPCTWSCPHYQCNNLCGEICDRPRCDAPCPKKLSCGHPCIGLCGENCPTVCAICHAKKLSSMLKDVRVNKTESTRCLQLFDCGHIITVKEMDEWMLHQQQQCCSNSNSDVQLMRCPRCSTSITFSYRYGNIVKRTLKNVEIVKTQVHQLVDDVSKSVHFLGNYLRCLNFDLRKLKFPQTVLCAMQYRRGVHQMHGRTILFLFIAKYHLMILKKVQLSQQVLAQVNTDAGISTQQGDVEQLQNITRNALENITEYLEQPQPNLKTLCQVHEHTRKFSLFSHVLEARMEVAKHQIPLSRTANNRLMVACDRFKLFFQGNDHALDLEWLQETVQLLRRELHLTALPPEETEDFANFAGYNKSVWKSCDKGHVYFTGWIVRGGEDIPVGSQGCSRCRAKEKSH